MLKKASTLLLAASIVLGGGTFASAAEPADPYMVRDIENHWAFESIADLMYAGIFSGYADNSFRPDNKVTRAEYLTALFRTAVVLENEEALSDPYLDEFSKREALLEQYKKANLQAPYQDLSNHWSKNAVAWVKQKADQLQPGLMARVFPGGSFKPDQPITREEAAAISYAFLLPPVLDREITFSDLSGTHPFSAEINSLVDNEVINGYPDGTFRPKDPITRAATTVILGHVMDDMNYRGDFFASEEFLFAPGSTYDAEYLPLFLATPDDLEWKDTYQETFAPATEGDRQYLSIFDSIDFDIQAYWEEEEVYLQVEDAGFEHGTPEFDAEIERLMAELAVKHDAEKAELGYLTEEERTETLRDLAASNYWNQAGVHYWLSIAAPEDYDHTKSLNKAIAAYNLEKNGADDLFFLYFNQMFNYAYENDAAKTVEMAANAYQLYLDHETDNLGPIEIDRFYLFAAYALYQVGEYDKAIAYLQQSLELEYAMTEYIHLEIASLMHLNGTAKAEVQAYLEREAAAHLNNEYFDEYVYNNYIWALKTLAQTN